MERRRPAPPLVAAAARTVPVCELPRARGRPAAEAAGPASRHVADPVDGRGPAAARLADAANGELCLLDPFQRWAQYGDLHAGLPAWVGRGRRLNAEAKGQTPEVG